MSWLRAKLYMRRIRRQEHKMIERELSEYADRPRRSYTITMNYEVDIPDGMDVDEVAERLSSDGCWQPFELFDWGYEVDGPWETHTSAEWTEIKAAGVERAVVDGAEAYLQKLAS